MTSWADQFNTYQDACDFYGCDGPRELAAEARYEAQEGYIETQDLMEARGGPLPDWRRVQELAWEGAGRTRNGVETSTFDEIPF